MLTFGCSYLIIERKSYAVIDEKILFVAYAVN